VERWAGLGGILYVILFAVGAIVASAGQPSSNDPPAELISYYSDSGHRAKIFVGWLLVVIGVFFLLWFVGALRQTVRRLDGDGLLAAVTTTGGAVYAASTLAAFSVDFGMKTASADTFADRVHPELIPVADDVAYLLHSAGGAGVGAMMAAASLAAYRARAVPAWLSWLGVVAGLLAVISFFFIPWFVIAAWLLVAGGLVTQAAASQGAQSAPR
jgi:hypothetical protein